MFYVYCYYNPLKPSNHDIGFEPFYVGKGKGNRQIHHVFESSLLNDPNRHKTNTIRKILDANLKPIVKVLCAFEEEADAFAAEKRFISLYGRADLGKGPLTNMTDGGEGTANKIYSPEYRKKISDATKKAHAEGKLQRNIEAFKNSQKGKKQSASHIEKRTSKRIGTKLSEETKSKISKAHSKVRQTDEWKKKTSLSQRGKKHSKEHIEKAIANNPKSQPIELMSKIYISINQAIKETGLTPSKIKKHPTFRLLPKKHV